MKNFGLKQEFVFINFFQSSGIQSLIFMRFFIEVNTIYVKRKSIPKNINAKKKLVLDKFQKQVMHMCQVGVKG